MFSKLILFYLPFCSGEIHCLLWNLKLHKLRIGCQPGHSIFCRKCFTLMWLLSCSKNQHNVLYFTSVLDLAYCVYSYCVTLMKRELPHPACLWTVTRNLILSGRMIQECNVLKVPLSEMEWEVIFGILKAVWKYISMFTPSGRLENGWEISICPFQSALFFRVIFWLVKLFST